MTTIRGGSGDISARVAGEHLRPIDVDVFPDRRSFTGVDRLSRELNDACTAAVTPHQIAALLEAEGLNDRLVRERYGRDGVFPLAYELYDRVPLRRSDEPAKPPSVISGIPRVPTPALLMRGPMYLVPLLFFLGAGVLFEGPAMLFAGLVSLLMAWSWNQGGGALTYRFIGRGDLPGAKAMARTSLAVGGVAITAVVATASWLIFGQVMEPAMFAAGQTAYLIGAACLLIFGLDRWLYLAVAPGVLAIGAFHLVPGSPTAIALLGTMSVPVLVAVAAVVKTRGGRWSSLLTLRGVDRHIAASLAFLGMLWALLIGLAGLSVAGGDTPIVTVSLAAAGMVITMGVSEWQIVNLRARVENMLIATGDTLVFARRARRAFVRSTQLMLFVIGTATASVVGISLAFDVIDGSGVMLAVGFVFLGLAFISGLVLITADRSSAPIGWSLLVLLELGAVLVATSLPPFESAAIYAFACFVLFAALFGTAVVTVGRPVVHR